MLNVGPRGTPPPVPTDVPEVDEAACKISKFYATDTRPADKVDVDTVICIAGLHIPEVNKEGIRADHDIPPTEPNVTTDRCDYTMLESGPVRFEHNTVTRAEGRIAGTEIEFTIIVLDIHRTDQ